MTKNSVRPLHILLLVAIAVVATTLSSVFAPHSTAALNPAIATAGAYSPAEPQSAPRIDVDGFFGANRAQRGRTVQAAVVIDIPGGYHVNANRPLGKYAVPTIVTIEAPNGVRVSPVTYPRGTARKFQFTNEQLAVYEGRAVMRFNVTVPANFNENVAQLAAKVRFQSCNDEVCFPPVTREVPMRIAVVNATDAVERINQNLFTGGSRRGR